MAAAVISYEALFPGLSPAEIAVKRAEEQCFIAEELMKKANEAKRIATHAMHLAQKHLQQEMKYKKSLEKALAMEARKAERQKDLEAYAVMWTAMTPEQRQAECDRHLSLDKQYNEQRIKDLHYYDEYLSGYSDMTLEEFKEVVAPIRTSLVLHAEKVLKLMIAGEMERAKEEGEVLKELLKGKSLYINTQVLYYARAGVEEQDAVKLSTFISRMAY
jgi:hypothetical protein